MKTLKFLAAAAVIAASFAQPSYALTNYGARPNGPSLDGFAQAPSIKGCVKGNPDCGDVNGPSLDGIVDNDAATQKSAQHKR